MKGGVILKTDVRSYRYSSVLDLTIISLVRLQFEGKPLLFPCQCICCYNCVLQYLFFVYLNKNADCNASDQEITKNFADIRIMDGQIANGEDHRCPSGPPSQHIALHLLSKVLDDETIFNLEESNNTPVETFLPLTVDPSIRCVIKFSGLSREYF